MGTWLSQSTSSCNFTSATSLAGTYRTVTLGHAVIATSANSAALFTMLWPCRVLLQTARFTVPPTPSTGPFPCAVPKKDQSTFSKFSCISEGQFRFLNWLPAPSEHVQLSNSTISISQFQDFPVECRHCIFVVVKFVTYHHKYLWYLGQR